MIDCEKMLTCWNCAKIASSDSEPMMDKMPTISGIAAATTPPNTNNKMMATKTRPIFSARAMSFAMPVSSASATAVAPATWTVPFGTSIASRVGWMVRKSFSVCSPSPFRPMATKALVCSSLTSCGVARSK